MRALSQWPSALERAMQPKSFYGWKLVVFFWLVIVLNFCFPTFGTSVVNSYMAKAMHLNRAQLGFAFTVFSLMAGLPGPLVAISIRRLGIRPTLVAGALLSSLGAFLMATRVNTVGQAVVVFGIIVGSGVALAGTIGPQVGVARWFHKKRGRAMSLLLTASGIGGFIAVPTLQRAIARDGGDWRAAWWLMSGMSLLAALIAAIFVRDSPAQMAQRPDGDPAAIVPELPEQRVVLENHGVYKTTEDWTLSEAFRTPTIWLLIFTYLGFFMGFFIYIAHGVLHLEGLGYSPGQAAESISIVLISSMIGQTTVAVIGDRVADFGGRRLFVRRGNAAGDPCGHARLDVHLRDPDGVGVQYGLHVHGHYLEQLLRPQGISIPARYHDAARHHARRDRPLYGRALL
jgi:sugar phosphate permease